MSIKGLKVVTNKKIENIKKIFGPGFFSLIPFMVVDYRLE